MPYQHNLKDWLREYIEAAGIGDDKDGPLFRTVDRKTKRLGSTRLDRQRARAMVKRRAQKTRIETTGRWPRTPIRKRRGDEVSMDEVERIGI